MDRPKSIEEQTEGVGSIRDGAYRRMQSKRELKPAALSSDTNDQWRAGDDAALGSAR